MISDKKKEFISKMEFFKNLLRISFNTIIPIVVSFVALIVSYQALKISDLAFRTSSLSTEPIIMIDIDTDNSVLTLSNDTNEIYQIRHVNFGLIIPICVSDFDNDIIYSMELQSFIVRRNLERGHTTGTDTPPEVAKKENISMTLKKEWAFYAEVNDELITQIKTEIKNLAEKNSNFTFLYNHYPYYYIQIFYNDNYGNRKAQYYIYQDEYDSTWQLYKMSFEEFNEYTKYVVYEHNKPLSFYVNLFYSENYKHKYSETKYAYQDWYPPFPAYSKIE